ncbi:ribonuclease HII [Halobacillus sp. A5]|uniref:ribonuclease HII n=1 Tax=Halobacillus sp. A5 TaxID=2880263 RepID=UPI0020A6542D|nr:ribonuclease HII [Halobacillus sp. A5]MCP3026139.1 ribonuclease HII [Halobacillus sp. A5]
MNVNSTIKEIKLRFDSGDLTEEELNVYRNDHRKGVQKLVAQHERNKSIREKLKVRFQEMKFFENMFRNKGKSLIAGIDEAGRGPLAGPVVAAAVILPEKFYLEGLYDSKQLSLHNREEYYDYIKKHADVGVGMVSSIDIDKLNIYRATKLAMKRAVEQLTDIPDQLLIDAMVVEDVPCDQESIIKGDQRSVSIAAASIIAKVTRDRYMKELSVKYPGYHFENNQGYGTKEHIQALQNYGITPYHRKSFSPVKERID